MSPKREKNKGDNANMLNNKDSFPFFSFLFFFFLIQNTSKGYTHLKRSSEDSSPGNPPIRAKQEFLFVYVDTYRLRDVKMKNHIRPSHDSTNACCICNSQTWSTKTCSLQL